MPLPRSPLVMNQNTSPSKSLPSGPRVSSDILGATSKSGLPRPVIEGLPALRVQQVSIVDVRRMNSKSFSRNRNSESRVQQFSEPAGMGACNLRGEYSLFVRREP